MELGETKQSPERPVVHVLPSTVSFLVSTVIIGSCDALTSKIVVGGSGFVRVGKGIRVKHARVVTGEVGQVPALGLFHLHEERAVKFCCLI